jgi:putative ABC transport system permease protein
VEKVSPLVNETKQLVYSNQNWSTTVRGVYPSYTEINKWEIQSGRNLSEDDVKNSAKVCIIGQTVAENLFGDLEPVGRTLRIAGVPFKVTGLLAEKGQNSMGMDQDDTVFIPVTTAQRKLFGTAFPGSVRQINVQAASAEGLASAEKEIKELLRERHKLGKSEEDDFTVRNFTQMLETVTSATNTMTLLLMAIASVSLLVGGIGIMNIMLVSVTERTKEIGIRSAIGATARDIRLQFLTESVILSLTGGIIGVFSGIIISLLIGAFSDMNIVISYVSVLISFGFAGIIGIIFGYYPAYKASLLRPVEALRYE